jgi:hypothetical protein
MPSRLEENQCIAPYRLSDASLLLVGDVGQKLLELVELCGILLVLCEQSDLFMELRLVNLIDGGSPISVAGIDPVCVGELCKNQVSDQCVDLPDQLFFGATPELSQVSSCLPVSSLGTMY